MRESKARKVPILGSLIVLILIGVIIGKCAIEKKIDIKIAVNKYRFDEREALKWRSSLAAFCFDLAGDKVKLHPGCKNKMKDIAVCGLQNEVHGQWDDSFLKYDPLISARNTAKTAAQYGCSELVIDFEGVKIGQKKYEDWLARFSMALKSDFKLHFAAYAKNQKTVSHPPANLQRYPFLCEHFDELWIMAYDYSIPPYTEIGEMAPLKWVSEVAQYAQRFCSNSQLRIGLAAYGYNWEDRSIISEVENSSNASNPSVETFKKRKMKTESLQEFGIYKFFIWSLGMFERAL